MGKKIEIKKIEDNVKSQVTFSKRRSSLIKKAEEISIACDVDVALLAFSPAGRLGKFCTRESIGDFLDLYVNLPIETRLSHLKNVQEKMGKLQTLATIKDEDGMTKFFNDQIENLKLRVEKNKKEVQLAEANLRDFELNPAQEPSLHQLSWCEMNLIRSIDKMKEIKKEKILMESGGVMPNLFSRTGSRQHQGQFDSWKEKEFTFPDNVFNEMLGKGKDVVDAYEAASVPTSYGLFQSVIPEIQSSLPNASLQNNSYNAMDQQGNAMAVSTFAPPQQQVNVNHVYPQQYGENYASDKQVESYPSFGNFAGQSSDFMETHLPSYPFGFPESNFNNLTNTLADGEIPVVENPPNLVPDHMDMDANGEGNEIYNNNEENADVVNNMIVSPPPSVQAPPPTSGVPNDSNDFLPFEDPSGDVSWIQNIEDAHIWDLDNFSFQ